MENEFANETNKGTLQVLTPYEHSLILTYNILNKNSNNTYAVKILVTKCTVSLTLFATYFSQTECQQARC